MTSQFKVILYKSMIWIIINVSFCGQHCGIRYYMLHIYKYLNQTDVDQFILSYTSTMKGQTTLRLCFAMRISVLFREIFHDVSEEQEEK